MVSPPTQTSVPESTVQEDLLKHPVFGDGPMALVSGENPLFPNPAGLTGHENMGKALSEMGLKAESTRGKYGSHEPSWIVHNPTVPQMQELGKRFGQESVAMRMNGKNFLMYTNGPKEGHITHPVPGHTVTQEEPQDFYTVLNDKNGKPGLHFSWNMDFDRPTIPLHELPNHLNNATPAAAAQAVLKSMVDSYYDILLGIRLRELAKAEKTCPEKKMNNKVFDLVKSQVEKNKYKSKDGTAHFFPTHKELLDERTEKAAKEKAPEVKRLGKSEAEMAILKTLRKDEILQNITTMENPIPDASGIKEPVKAPGSGGEIKKGLKKEEMPSKSSWDSLKPEYQSEHKGWSKAGEFHCPHCHTSIGRNLKGPHGEQPFASAHRHMQEKHAEHLNKEEMPGAKAPAPGGKPQTQKPVVSSKPAGIPASPKPPQAPGAMPSMHKDAMSMGPKGAAPKDQAVGTPTSGSAPVAQPIPSGKAAVASFRPASPGAAGGMPKIKSPATLTKIQR